MTAEDITAQLRTRTIGRPVRVYQEVSSTNNVAMDLANEGAPEGCVIFAERQTAGRGRLGRAWETTPGTSLAFSILLRPTWENPSRLSLATAVVLARVLANHTPECVGIKWPNDIYIGGSKVAGILCESSGGAMIVGVGINVSQRTADFPHSVGSKAGSLTMFSEINPDRAALAAALLNEFERVYESLPAAFAEIVTECEERSTLLGEEIAVQAGSQHVTGTVIGITSDGCLRIRSDTGKEEIITAGEVTLLTRSI